MKFDPPGVVTNIVCVLCVCMCVRRLVNVRSPHRTGSRGRADSARLPDEGSKPRLADEDRGCRIPVRSAQAHAVL